MKRQASALSERFLALFLKEHHERSRKAASGSTDSEDGQNFGSRHRSRNEEELSRFLASPRVALAVVDAETAENCAVILATLLAAGTPVPTNDLWIASSAMQHGCVVLTADAHFERIVQVRVHRLPPR